MTWGWWGEGRDFLLHPVHICTNLHITSQALPVKCQSFSGQEVITAVGFQGIFSPGLLLCLGSSLHLQGGGRGKERRWHKKHPPLHLPPPHPTSPLSWQRLSEGRAEVPACRKLDQGSSEDPRILPDATDAAGG